MVLDSCPFLTHIMTCAGDLSPTNVDLDHLLGVTFLYCKVTLAPLPIFYRKPHLFAVDWEGGGRTRLRWISAASLRSLDSVWCPPPDWDFGG